MDEVTIRQAEPEDRAELAVLFHCLWPKGSIQEHASELALLLQSKFPASLPGVIFVAHDRQNGLVGFIEVDLRSHADGCEPSRPVGYVEGWYVVPGYRRRKIAARLLTAAEEWARSNGCREMASDTWLDNLTSQHVHEALGFEVVERSVLYRKDL